MTTVFASTSISGVSCGLREDCDIVAATEISNAAEARIMPPAADLYRGGRSVRFGGEKRTLALCILFAPTIIGFIAFALHERMTGYTLTVLVIAALTYVSLARGRLLGTSVRVHEGQLPRVFAVVRSCARQLGVPLPLVFVREDLHTPVVALGLQEPFSLVISSRWLTPLDDNELAFLIGRELGHIYAGHTRLSSLVSSSGADNPLLGIVMGPWLRKTEYTADRIGLLCCGSTDVAVAAMLRTEFGEVAEEVDPASFASQREEIAADQSLRIGEWTSREPYVTHRVYQLRAFAATPLFTEWRDRLAQWSSSNRADTFHMKPPPGIAALLVDVLLLVYFVNYLIDSNEVTVQLGPADAGSMMAWVHRHAAWTAGYNPTSANLADLLRVAVALTIAIAIYVCLTLILRRTPGMLIFGVPWRRRPQ